jgi:hypothetical protein
MSLLTQIASLWRRLVIKHRLLGIARDTMRFASRTTNYVIFASHNQFCQESLPYITAATALLTTIATTFYQLLHSINYYHIRASLSLIPFHIIYISYYTLHERIVWPISPQFEHFDGAFFLITLWSDDMLSCFDILCGSGNIGSSISRYSDASLPRPILQN